MLSLARILAQLPWESKSVDAEQFARGSWFSCSVYLSREFHANLNIIYRAVSQNFGLLTVTLQVHSLESYSSYLLCPMSQLQSNCLADASAVQPSWQWQLSAVTTPRHRRELIAYKFINNRQQSLFLVATDAKLFQPGLGVSGGKEKKKMKALFCTWLDICVSELPCCVSDVTAGAVLLNVNFVHQLESKLVLDPSEI